MADTPASNGARGSPRDLLGSSWRARRWCGRCFACRFARTLDWLGRIGCFLQCSRGTTSIERLLIRSCSAEEKRCLYSCAHWPGPSAWSMATCRRGPYAPSTSMPKAGREIQDSCWEAPYGQLGSLSMCSRMASCGTCESRGRPATRSRGEACSSTSAEPTTSERSSSGSASPWRPGAFERQRLPFSRRATLDPAPITTICGTRRSFPRLAQSAGER
mmetsp:Transcript_2276/g.9802  ORF Transcript_2276/g.9802 Transcript_2276/m.9802 type:complete len:217 (+) Transcript_2276:260-910(+)